MKVLICGSRTITNYTLVEDTILAAPFTISTVISGGARGVDELAERFAKEHHIPIEIHRPDWAAYGKAAGMIRNTDMVAAADAVIAIWDGKSRGTLDSINKAKAAGKPLWKILYPKLPQLDLQCGEFKTYDPSTLGLGPAVFDETTQGSFTVIDTGDDFITYENSS